RARHAQVGLDRDGDPCLPAHGQDVLLRRVQVPARAELGHRRRAADPHDGDVVHRLPAAVRPAVVLGDDRGCEHQRHRPARRPIPVRLPARWRGVRRYDAVSLLRDPHVADPRGDRGADRRAPVPGHQARHHRAAVAEGQRRRSPPRGSRMNAREKEQYLREYSILKSQGKPFFPYAVAKDSLMAVIVMAVIIALSIVLGAELGPKADPTTTTYVPRPEWYFFFLFELLRVVKPPELVPLATIGIPTVCLILLLLLPFYDRGPERRPERRPIATTAGILTIGAMAYLTFLGASAGSTTAIDIQPPKQVQVAGGAALADYNAGRQGAAESGCLACHQLGQAG